jgi:hypothetical protein
VTSDWRFVWTPQFFVGTIFAGLLLNVVGTYAVRGLDRIRTVLPAAFRRGRDEESARIQQLVDAGTSDNSLYAALAAEASRLRVHQLLHFFFAFVCIDPLLLLAGFGELKPGGDVRAVLVLVLLISIGLFQYVRGLDAGKRARRLDGALRVVRQNRKLPIMD